MISNSNLIADLAPAEDRTPLGMYIPIGESRAFELGDDKDLEEGWYWLWIDGRITSETKIVEVYLHY